MENSIYATIRDALMQASPNGSGLIERDFLIKLLQSLQGSLSTPCLERFLQHACPMNDDAIPIRLLLDFIFQRFPGLPGAADADLSAIFELIDKNGNGKLEKSEVLRAAQSPDEALTSLCAQIPCLTAFLDVDKWEVSFTTMDTNADGVISWFEFIHFFAHSGRPEKDGGECEQHADLMAVFSCIDKNQNGVLEKAEVLAAVNSQDTALRDFCQQVPSILPLLKSDSWQEAFTNLDTNADGKISWAEFIAFFKPMCCYNPHRLLKLSKDEKTDTGGASDAFNQDYDYLFKILLIGNSCVGKSNILLRFSENVFHESFLPTIGVDFKIKNVDVNNKLVKLHIWDTAGQEGFTATYYEGAHGIILVYDITDRQSFADIENWLGEIQRHAFSGRAWLLVGNKCDLENQRQVSYQEGKEYADSLGINFLETSAKNKINIEETFKNLTLVILPNFLPNQPDHH